MLKMQCASGETLVLEHCRGHRSTNKKGRKKNGGNEEEEVKIRNALSKVVVKSNVNTTENEENTASQKLVKHYIEYASKMPEMVSQCVTQMLLLKNITDVNERYVRASKNIMGYDLSQNMAIKRAVLTILANLAEHQR
jgi:hypothetical protein